MKYTTDKERAVPSTRRQIVIAISHLAAAATLAACSRSTESASTAASSELELLASVAYDILPYPELPAASYVKAAQQILDLHDDSVSAGILKLRDATHNKPWKDVAEPERVAILASLQDSAFFSLVRATSLQVLLRDPATFAVIGYGGSTRQFGGYINRGFDDISWLPASRKN
jgi:hypothetical protein